MLKLRKTFLAAIASIGFATGANATTITFDSVLDGDLVSTSAVSGVTIVDFNDQTCGAYASCSGDFNIVIGDRGGKYAAPYVSPADSDDATYYMSVPDTNTRNSGTDRVAIFDLGLTANYFGMLWGSVDRYNTLQFLLGDTIVDSYVGNDVSALANGNQGIAATNFYVNFFNLPTFDTIRMISTSFAFETDNHAFGQVAVPEPGVLGLLALGLVGLGVTTRRRQHLA